jgi:deferrochelatase/peroxidase EfeB
LSLVGGTTRRRLLASAGLAAGGVLAGSTSAAAGSRGRRLPFHGRYQGGITTPPQGHLRFAAFDVAGSRADLAGLLRAWSEAAARMCDGDPVGPVGGDPSSAPVDTGDAYGLPASRLTLTIGFGPSLFDRRFGLRAARPPALIDLPAFRGDRLDAARTGGDLGVQACADDPQVAFHAVRTLARIGRGLATARWSQSGFDSAPDGGTGRNLMGFKDGTNNLDRSDTAVMDRNVWVGSGDEPAWMRGGTYLVTRRIRIRIERWDASDLDEQETDVGRRKVSGAPFGARSEFAPVDPAREPRHSHIMLANPRRPESEAERILRRGYSFDDGLLPDVKLDAGLFFAAFQRDPRRQFVPIQRRLAAHDLLGEYLVHTGSAIFAVPPGCEAGGYVGDTLL